MRRAALGILAAVVLALAAAACSSGDSEPEGTTSETGLVVSVDTPSLGQVDGFELLTDDGQTLAFDTTDLEFDAAFPVSHLSEHQLLSDPVRVTYHPDGERLVVTRLEDGS